MEILYERIRKTWLARGVRINDGASQDSIAKVESAYHLALPAQLCSYLVISNGMADGETDEHLISFLSLHAIEDELRSQDATSQYVDIIFAEYLIFSHYYAIRAARDGVQIGVYVSDGEHERCIASSFDEFLEVYLSNPEDVVHFM